MTEYSDDYTSTPEVDEFTRQRALDSYRIVDSLPETAYDDIVRVAAAVCGTPIALVSLIDRDRQWFKSKIGLEDSETSRDVAVCDHAIRTPGQLMEVRDLAQDARFSAYPAVTGLNPARFYAGMPLVTPEGAAIGTVCVLDHEPRTLTDLQRGALEALGRLTIALLEGRSRERALEREALLQPVDAVASTLADAGGGYAIVILEVQDFAGVVARLGERAADRALQQLDQELERCMDSAHGDTVNRVTGSTEFIAVLQGEDTEAALLRLHEVAARHAGLGIRLAIGAARATSGNEPTQQVFLRADEALTIGKNGYAGEAVATPG